MAMGGQAAACRRAGIWCGQASGKAGLPSILGWLITGMAFGPHALGLLQSDVLDSAGSVRPKVF